MEIPKVIRLFIDCEFTDFINRDLISIGVAADNGDEFYGINAEYLKPWASTWVNEHVVPLLDFDKHGMRRLELSARLWSWVEELPCDFVVWCSDYRGDLELLDELFGGDKHPKTIENQNIFNNMYYSLDEQVKAMGGTDTAYEQLVRSAKTKFELYVLDYFFRTKETQHHALSDAKANREAYTRLINEMGIPK